MQETQVQAFGWENPLEQGMATHSSILAWRTPWTEKPCGLQSMGLQRVTHNWATNTLSLLNFKDTVFFFLIEGCDSFALSTSISSVFEQHLLTLCIHVTFWVLSKYFKPSHQHPASSVGKQSTCHAGDPSSIPGSGDSLEKRKATHFSILGWRIPWTV